MALRFTDDHASLQDRSLDQQKLLGNVGPPRKEPATLWKINMEPKHGGLEDDFPFQFDDF